MLNGNLINSDTTIKASILGYTPTKATETKRGLVRLATEEEAKEGIINDAVVITPYTLKQSIGEIAKNTTFVFEQSEASDVWLINHKMNKKPSITTVDSADNVVIGEEEYIDANNLVIRFNGQFKGKAYLN